MGYPAPFHRLLFRVFLKYYHGDMTEERTTNIKYPEVIFSDVIKTFWQGMKPAQFWMWVIFLSVIFINIINAIIPIFYKKFFDVISKSSGPNSQTAEILFFIIIEIAILNGIVWTLWRLANHYNIIFEIGTIARLKQGAFDYIMEHSYGFFSNNFTGSLVQRVNRFARAFERLIDRLVYNILPLFVQITASVVIVWFVEPVMAMIIFIWVAILLSTNIFFARWKFKYDVKVAEVDSKTTGYLADAITNHNTIQLFSGLKKESEGFRRATNEQAKTTKFAYDLDFILESVQAFFLLLIEFVLFYYTIKYWEKGLVTVGVFVLFQAYVIDLSGRLWDFTRVARDAYQGYAEAKEMVEILKLPHEIKDVPIAKNLEAKNGQIEFKNLSFSFNETREVLRSINLRINSGEKVALVGPSGSGKTTFVRLLLRLYSPTAGSILIDGQDINFVTQKSLRNSISLVPQDPILFHRTLADNIGYGKSEATREDVEKAGKMAHCQEFVSNFPRGYDTYVGERGVKLSGGERQRVAIARAILKDAPILILDEATSSLDSNSENLIQDALMKLMEKKTTIVIAHRLSTIQRMDRIIVLENGKIVEEGKHDELIRKNDSLYGKLWSLQAGGFLGGEGEEE